MGDNKIKNCSVMLKPCTPLFRKCYVSLEKSKIVPIKENSENTKTAKIDTPRMIRPTEPCTPNAEPALATELRRAIAEKNILTTKTKSKFISALNELEQASAETDRKQRKEKATKEVLDSEIAYLNQLEIIIKYFKIPLTERYILSEEEIERIFNKITLLYNINKELLNAMDENPANIALSFKKVAPFFKMYSTYAYDYKMISQFLQVLVDKNENFSNFLKCQETRPEVKMKLSSLLIAPIQRIPRYCLLLKHILLYTLEVEEDYQTLTECLQIVEESAKHINSLVEERENSEKLLSIQNALTNNVPLIIKPGRKLIKEGKILKMMDTVGTIMYLVATTDILMFCKIKKENVKSKNALKCVSILPLNKCTFTQNANMRKIHITCEHENVEIYIETTKEFYQWVDVLKETRKNIIHNRHTLRKESSSRRPASKDDFSGYNEVGISPGIRQRKRKGVTESVKLQDITDKTKDEHVQHKPLFLLKRRCLRDVRAASVNGSANDSLYPLRHHYISDIQKANKTTIMGNQNKDLTLGVPEPDEHCKTNVFVFGEPRNPNPGFNFGIANIFTYIGHSLRRLFRIK